jgi:hypothetical protein
MVSQLYQKKVQTVIYWVTDMKRNQFAISIDSTYKSGEFEAILYLVPQQRSSSKRSHARRAGEFEATLAANAGRGPLRRTMASHDTCWWTACV